MLITIVTVSLLLVVVITIIGVRFKNANNRKRNGRQPTGDKQDVIVHQRSNGQVATSIVETDTDPDLIQVKYGKLFYFVFVVFVFDENRINWCTVYTHEHIFYTRYLYRVLHHIKVKVTE